MKQKPLVSIIILNLNGLQDSIDCISSIIKTHGRMLRSLEVIVIDNGSTFDEAVILKKKFKNVIKTFRLDKNLGFCGGNNWALKKANGKYLFLLNNDATIEKNCLKELIKTLDKEKKIAVVQPKIKLFRDKKRFDYAGACGGFLDRFGYPFTRGRIFEDLEIDRGQYDTVKDIFWASGAAMMIRKSVIDKLGYLFDEQYFNYMEEIDFCWRVMNAGFRVMSVPQSVVYHKVASTAKKSLFKKRYWEHRNNLILLTKNLADVNLLPTLAVRFILEIMTYFFYLGTGRIKFVGSLFFAHLHFLLLAPKILFKRNKSQIVLNKLPIYRSSLCLDYFLRKRNMFSQLQISDSRDS